MRLNLKLRDKITKQIENYYHKIAIKNYFIEHTFEQLALS